MDTIAPISPMLAKTGPPPLTSGTWAFEFKWDGQRAVIFVSENGLIQLRSRSGHNITDTYPELALTGMLAPRRLVLDGEIVAMDSNQVPDLGILQQRMHVARPSAWLLASVPVAFIAFDVLHIDGDSLLGTPYRIRREILRSLQLGHPYIAPKAYTDVTGAELLTIAAAHRMEGIVAKRLASCYEPGRRSGAWIKTVLRERREIVIAGWRPSTRPDRPLGSLMMGAYYAPGRLAYLGDVGTGFTHGMLRYLRELLNGLAADGCPFDDPDVPTTDVHWVRPQLVAEIEYRTTSANGRLRYASFVGLRTDKHAADITLGAAP